MNNKILAFFLVWITFAVGYFALKQLNTKQDTQQSTQPSECLTNFDATIAPVNKEFEKNLIPNSEGIYILPVKVTNNSDKNFVSANTKGGVNAAYRWFTKNDNSQVLEGDRAYFKEPLPSKGKTEVELTIKFPKEKGDYILRLDLVQEACTWFNDKNPNSKYEIFYSVK